MWENRICCENAANLFFFEKVKSKFLVVSDVEFLNIQFREDIKSWFWFYCTMFYRADFSRYDFGYNRSTFGHYPKYSRSTFDKRNSLYYPKWIMGNTLVQRILKRLYIELTGGYDKTLFLNRKNTTKFKFYFGSQWWCLNNKTIEWMIKYCDEHKEYFNFYKNCVIRILRSFRFFLKFGKFFFLRPFFSFVLFTIKSAGFCTAIATNRAKINGKNIPKK